MGGPFPGIRIFTFYQIAHNRPLGGSPAKLGAGRTKEADNVNNIERSFDQLLQLFSLNNILPVENLGAAPEFPGQIILEMLMELPLLPVCGPGAS
jgi:hypothetical protein